MFAAIGAKQLKLAGSWLSGAAKLAGYASVGGSIDIALRSIDLAEALRPGQDDIVTQALGRVRTDVEAGTKAALAAEFGADWERRGDLSATIVALPLVLERYALDIDAIFAANLNPERIAEEMADAADAAHDDLFRRQTLGETMLRRVVTEAYTAALSNKDFALKLLLRGQSEFLQRQDRHAAKLAEMEEANERRHRELLESFAREKGVDPKVLAPLFDNLGQTGLTLEEMRSRAGEAIKATIERSLQKIGPSNEGADIDATIGAARARLGHLDTAGARLVLAAKIAEEAEVNRRRLVPLLEEQAAVERLSYDYEAAKATLRQLLALDPEHVWSWIELGDLFVTTAALDQAINAFHHSLAIAGRLTKSDPGNTDWQRDLSVSYDRVGNVLVAQGKLPEALKTYRDSQAIFDRLAKSDPGNAGWQRDLSVSFTKVGDVLVAQGTLPEALQTYRDSLAIADRLTKSDPGNAGWQRDLSVSFNKVGDVLVAQGNLPEALKTYRDSLAIADRLAKSDPGNAGWQRDLSVSYERVGNVLVAQGNLPEALKTYRDSQAIFERLAKSDPGNAGWQRDLSVSFNNVGDVLVAQGNLPEALKTYRDSLAIRDRLAKSDPGNAGWQRDLSVSYGKLAVLSRKMDASAEALTALRQGQVIIARMTQVSPDNAVWKNDLVWFNDQIAQMK